MLVSIKTYDVWGNAEDGYQVNDVFNYGTVDFDGSEDDLCNNTVAFLNEHFFAKQIDAISLNIEINDNGDYLDITVEDSEDCKPICELCVDRTK